MVRSVAVSVCSKERTTGGATNHRGGLERLKISTGTTALLMITIQG